MVKFVASSPFGIHKARGRTAMNYLSSHISNGATKAGKSSSYTSRPLLRVNPNIFSKDDKDIKTVKNLGGDEDVNKYKSDLKSTKSNYWKDVFCNQWLLALQGIAIIILILTIGTWMGQECKDNVVNDVPVLVESWRSAIEQLKETILDVGPKLRSYYNIEEDFHQKRRPSILRRYRFLCN
ncbi:uncharacterized protein LOC109864036 [Pseudomyrmex gracilis]|uniref:uncharacterized protein LOC109864036 n=1 Tax=Pseudomyrmex gracilis TaxID=219809 RepID=UPI000995B8A7|nr:uncharacterized protein LOC109864036 [Pseudomyrmex gracilis]